MLERKRLVSRFKEDNIDRIEIAILEKEKHIAEEGREGGGGDDMPVFAISISNLSSL